MPPEYVIGADLGQANDYTAVTVLHRDTRQRLAPPPRPGIIQDRPTIQGGVTYLVRHLERFELGMPYPKQVERIARLTRGLRGEDPYTSLVIDATGVGRPVVDMLRDEDLQPRAVIITGGDSETHSDGFYRVPKRNLVSVMQVLLQSKRLKIHSRLKHAATLVEELLAFKVTISARGHDSYSNDWRENDHDDLVLATALAAYWAEKHPHIGHVPKPAWARMR